MQGVLRGSRELLRVTTATATYKLSSSAYGPGSAPLEKHVPKINWPLEAMLAELGATHEAANIQGLRLKSPWCFWYFDSEWGLGPWVGVACRAGNAISQLSHAGFVEVAITLDSLL